MRLIQRLTIPLILLTLVYVSSNLHTGKDFWKRIITFDGKGYYSYLPAIFIYNDLNFGFFDEIEAKYYDSKESRYDYRMHPPGGTTNKYFAGTALLEMPFFLVAHAITKISGGEADGYSYYYQLSVSLAAIVYAALGLIYFRKLLRSYQAGDIALTLLPLILVFGTNLFYYTVVECSMSHVYSFAAITMFLWYSRMFLITHNARYFLYSTALLGLAVLIRPVNGIVLLWLPFAAGSFDKLKAAARSLRDRPLLQLGGTALGLLVAGTQLIIYKIQTGHFLVDAYGHESFNFLAPELWNFLFSYKKGLFVYLPLTFVSLLGFVYLWRRSRFQALSLFVFLFVLVYVMSSWWSWWYGGSFGTRVLVEYMAVFGLLLLLAFKSFEKKWPRYALGVLVVALTLFCQLQTYQYRYQMIHWENMDKERYWNVFMNFDFRQKNP